MRTIALTTFCTLILSACGSAGDWLRGRTPAESSQQSLSGDPTIDRYIEELGAIASGDPAAQAEIYADAAAAAQLTPGATTNLRLGLVLAIPGHPESDALLAQSLLREVLTQDLLLTPAEIALATIHLNSVERQIVTQSETRRLRESSAQASNAQQRTFDRQLEAVEAENRALKTALDEAEEKLDAITSIERSIREQE